MFKATKDISTGDVVSSTGIVFKAGVGGFLFIGGFVFLLIAHFAPSIISGFSIGILWKSLFGYLPIVFGIASLAWSFVSLKKLRMGLAEKKTLRIVGEMGGVVTAAKLALKSGMSVSKATEVLQRLQLKGLAEVDANEEGAVCYKFYDLMG